MAKFYEFNFIMRGKCQKKKAKNRYDNFKLYEYDYDATQEGNRILNLTKR